SRLARSGFCFFLVLYIQIKSIPERTARSGMLFDFSRRSRLFWRGLKYHDQGSQSDQDTSHQRTGGKLLVKQDKGKDQRQYDAGSASHVEQHIRLPARERPYRAVRVVSRRKIRIRYRGKYIMKSAAAMRKG